MQGLVSYLYNKGYFMRQLEPSSPPSWPSQSDKSRAASCVPLEILNYLYQLEQIAADAHHYIPFNALSVAAHYEDVAKEWLKVTNQICNLDNESGLVLLAEKVQHFYWLASSYYYKEITNKHAEKIAVDLAIYEKCLNLKIIACGFYYTINNHNMITSAMRDIGEVDRILNNDLGAHTAGILFLKLAKWSSGLGNYAPLVQSLYGYAAKNLKSGFYNISNPYNQIFKDYQEALCGAWNYVVILKDLANQGEGDLGYCLGLEKTVGDEIEQMSQKLSLFHSQGYSVPSIAFAGNKESTITQNPNLRYRRKPW